MTRRLSEQEAAAALARAVPISSGMPMPRRPRLVLHGVDPSGATLEVRLKGLSLVAFLSTTCDGCRELARLVREGVSGFEVLGVLRAPTDGLPNEEASSFMGEAGRWLLGDDPFAAFEVRAAPFFSILDADGRLVVEGVAFGESHVIDHCARVLARTPRPDADHLGAEPG